MLKSKIKVVDVFEDRLQAQLWKNTSTTNTTIDIFGDLHLQEEILRFQFSEIERQANATKSKIAIFLGDIFHDRKVLQSVCMFEFRMFLQTFLTQRYELIILIAGNHDKHQDDANFSLLTFFEDKKKIFTIDNSKIIAVNGFAFVFLPFFSDDLWYAKMRKVLGNFESDMKYHSFDHFVFGHKILKSAKLSRKKDIKSESKVDITPKMFKNQFYQIFLGDLHLQNEDKKKKVFYTGSFFQNNFGEDNYKGLATYNIYTKVLIHQQTKQLFFHVKIQEQLKDNLKKIDTYFDDIILASGKDKRFVSIEVLLFGETIDKFFDAVQHIKHKYESLFRRISFKTEVRDAISIEAINSNDEKQLDLFDAVTEYASNEEMTTEQINYGKQLLK